MEKTKNKFMKDISEFEKEIGLDFDNKELLETAFTHRSYLNETKEEGRKLEHNERIEFLGDAVLELSATDFLFKKFKDEKEGVLTAYRSSIVNTDILAKVGEDLDFSSYLKMSKGEMKDTHKGRHHILANTFEAVVGAIYLDKGFNEADKFINEYLLPYMDEILEEGTFRDPKSHFQEIAQEVNKVTPVYKTHEDEGPDHDKMFVVGLYLGDELVSEGKGPSKQKAQVDAAKNGIEKKGW